jgi:hypothetical protein
MVSSQAISVARSWRRSHAHRRSVTMGSAPSLQAATRRECKADCDWLTDWKQESGEDTESHEIDAQRCDKNPFLFIKGGRLGADTNIKVWSVSRQQQQQQGEGEGGRISSSVSGTGLKI